MGTRIESEAEIERLLGLGASLGLPGVKAAITRGRPLIAGFSHRVETVPLGGIGLLRAAADSP